MSKIDELRRRVERLIAGERNTADLYALFLWLRERSFGNKAVADIGDFVAHSEERDKGVAWKGVQHFFNAARFVVPRMAPEKPGATLVQLSLAAWSNFELLDPADFKAKTGLGKSKAKKVLESAFSAVLTYDGTTFLQKRPLTPKENELLNFFGGTFMTRAAFTADDLTSQFWKCLSKNNLIADPGPNPPQHLAAFVSLYAIERMHRSKLILQDGSIAELDASMSPAHNDLEDLLNVNASARVLMKSGIQPRISFPIYTTNLKAAEWCEPVLLPAKPNTHPDWNFALEIGPNGKLRQL